VDLASNKKSIRELSRSRNAGRLVLFCGSGVSIDAGSPSWEQLLLQLLESMITRISKNQHFTVENHDPNIFQKKHGPSGLIIGKYLKSNLGEDFLPELRKALYLNNPTTCSIIEALIELARPQRDGKPIDSIVTFNFDGLIEEGLNRQGLSYKEIFSEDTRFNPGELPVYHVHGYLPRKGTIPLSTEIIFSEDAYHDQFMDPFSWSNLIQLNKLSQNTCLLLGLSLSDPNIRRLLNVANRKKSHDQLVHHIIKRKPIMPGTTTVVDELALLLEEQDANEMGLNVLWVDEFEEIAPLIREIAKPVT
jgi:hypothetical protein